jgi:hypothetical protein
MYKKKHDDPSVMDIDLRSHCTSGVMHDQNNILMIFGSSLHAVKKLASGDLKGHRAVVAIETAVGRRTSPSNEILRHAGQQQADRHFDFAGETDRDATIQLPRGPPNLITLAG